MYSYVLHCHIEKSAFKAVSASLVWLIVYLHAKVKKITVIDLDPSHKALWVETIF